MLHGIETSETNPPYSIAAAEKALLDTIYIGTRKGRRFAALPELNGAALSRTKLKRMFRRQGYPARIAGAMERRLRDLALW